MKKKIRNKISDTLDLPKEVIVNVPSISLIGDNEIEIENHKGIIEYSLDIVRLNSSIGVILIKGNNFLIREISEDAIKLIGNFKSLEIIK
ncbi:MAG: sporulation protein YqfC [Clostridiales bacterium]|nr:sporulation protein YqfC [Clostridiales bacterium]